MRVLSPLSIVFGGITRFRNWLYDRHCLKSIKCRTPVVSVGNISVGGTGKTPHVILIAKIYKELGYNPVILLRGYKGRVEGPHLVSEKDDFRQVGDEALLLKRKTGCPVVISKKRVPAAIYIEERKLGDVIVLDDGFQHRALYRDLDVVLVDASSNAKLKVFLKGELLPVGRLRENPVHALKRADAVVFSNWHSEVELGDVEAIISNDVSVYRSKVIPLEPYSLRNGSSLDSKQVALFSAIGSPENFQRTVLDLGLEIKSLKTFSDHHNFSRNEIVSLKCESGGTPLLCSEKDAVKIPDDLKDGIFVLPINVQVEPKEQFQEALLSVFLEESARLSGVGE